MEIDQIEWLRRENYFLREQNKKLKNELSETKKYLEEILTKFKEINKRNNDTNYSDASDEVAQQLEALDVENSSKN